MIFAQRELAKARETFEDKREALLVFQAENNILDAEASAKSKAEVISGLEAMLTKERTTLKSLLSNLGANTPQVRQQRTRIRSLEQQLEIEMHRLVASSSDGKLNVVASKYRNLMIDASIAEEAYKFAVSSVESSRIEASKKLRSLITIVAPNYPDKAIYPERIYNLLVALIVVFLLYGIAKMIVASIQDHKD